MKILIVDDDRLSRILLCRTLENAGYGTEQADSARTAKDILKSGEPIILMICDLTMPGTDGMAFLAEIRSTPCTAELPVLICTTQDMARWHDAADCLGISGYIAKPLNAQELVEKVSRVLESAVAPIDDASAVQRRLRISVEDYIESLEGLVTDLRAVQERIEKCSAETDFGTLDTNLDGLAGSAQSLGALRVGPVLKTLAHICREKDAGRIREDGSQLIRELRILRSALELLKQEQTRFRSSSKAECSFPPMQRGMNWKQFTQKKEAAIPSDSQFFRH